MRTPPTPERGPGTLRLVTLALRFLSPLAPRDLRGRWLKEWEGESGHWTNAPGTNGNTSFLGSMALLWTAARDASHLRFFRPISPARSRDPVHRPKDTSMFGPILQDFRFSLRTARSAPWFSAVSVLTLALGIGSSVAMFGVLHAVFLRPLPFSHPQELVVGRATVEGHLNPFVSGADYYDYRDQAQTFQELAAVLPFPSGMTESGRAEAQRVALSVASPNLFSTLGVSPALGRTFLQEDGLAGAQDVVLLSHSYWLNALGGDVEALGTSLTLDGNPFTVVGVLPPDFFFMLSADAWIPMRPDRWAAASRGNHNWYLVGRLTAGTTQDRAQAEVDAISARLQAEYPETNANKALLITGLHQVLTEDYRLSLWLISGAVLLVLLIACGNGAGILLARAPSRRFDLSVRSAMGAPRGRLVRQLLSESLGLALAAGALGTLLAVGFQRVMLQFLSMERLGLEDPGVSLPILGAALGVSLVAGLMAGIYPALKGAAVSVTEGLKTGYRGVGDGGSGFRSGLVVVQVALSITLLAGSGLMIRSLTNLRELDPGFDAEGVVTAGVQIPSTRYPTVQDRHRFFSTLQAELQATPGIQAATLTSHLPIADFGNIYRASTPGRAEEPVRIFLRAVFPGYFETLGIPILSGRGVDASDEEGSPWVVILSRTAAERLFPDEDPLGKVVEMPFAPNPRLAEVVGVVGDVRLSELEQEPEAAVYVPYAHHARTGMRMALEAQVPLGAVSASIREILQRIDPKIPLSRVATLESLVSDSMAERRIITLALTLLALLPMVLASVGLFAVLAYHVSRRKHEMGVRMALGANATDVSGLILKQGLRMAAVGTLLGLAGAMGATRFLHAILFGVEPGDPLTLFAVAALVMTVAAVACAVPVWRATRADPRVVLEAQ